MLVSATKEKNLQVLDHVIELLSKVREKWAIDALVKLLGESERKSSPVFLKPRLVEALASSTGKVIEGAADWKNYWTGLRETAKDPSFTYLVTSKSSRIQTTMVSRFNSCSPTSSSRSRNGANRAWADRERKK